MTGSPSKCPSEVELRACITGAMDEDAAHPIQEHIDGCSRCQERVDIFNEREANIHQQLRDLAETSELPTEKESPANAGGREIPVSITNTIDSSDADSSISPGLSFSGYEVVRELHRGGQGVVYQAVQTSTKRKVAIKVLLEGPYASARSRRRFEREIELVASLKHPNIISIFHSGQTADGRQYCVMDYIRGVPLNQYVREKDLDLEGALRLFQMVCNAVSYAHQKGVIHRDLKPSNILVDSNGTVKVLDFGLAKMVGGPEQTLISMTGQVVGTLPYMSPEQTHGNPDEIDTRTDVYALGVILYEMLTGEYPYPVVGQMADVLKHIAETEPTPPTRQWKRDSGIARRSSGRRSGACPIDDEIQTIVLRTLAKDRDRRYQSAGELSRDIGHYFAGEPIEAKRDSGLYILRKYVGRHRRSFIATVVIATIAIGAFTGLRIYRRSQIGYLLQRADAMLREARYPEAIENSNDALELEPENTEALRLASAAYLRAATALDKRRRHDLDRAFELSTRLTKLAPDNYDGWNQLCIAEEGRGRTMESIDACKKAIAIDPDEFHAYTNLGRSYIDTGQLETAARELKRAIEINQEMSGLMSSLNLASIQRAFGESEADKTLSFAEKLVAKYDYGPERTARVHAVRAMVNVASMDKAVRASAYAAAQAAHRELGENHTNAKVYRVLALTQIRLENPDWDQALADANRAIGSRDSIPSFPNLIAAIASVHAGKSDAARKYYFAAVDAWPQGGSEYFIDQSDMRHLRKDMRHAWIDTRAELEALRDEAQQLINEAN